jgi:hypothetical protein
MITGGRLKPAGQIEKLGGGVRHQAAPSIRV